MSLRSWVNGLRNQNPSTVLFLRLLFLRSNIFGCAVYVYIWIPIRPDQVDCLLRSWWQVTASILLCPQNLKLHSVPKILNLIFRKEECWKPRRGVCSAQGGHVWHRTALWAGQCLKNVLRGLRSYTTGTFTRCSLQWPCQFSVGEGRSANASAAGWWGQNRCRHPACFPTGSCIGYSFSKFLGNSWATLQPLPTRLFYATQKYLVGGGGARESFSFKRK